MAEKKYYWLKLNEGFFRQKVIKKLRKIAGGDTYTVIYLEMQLLSLKKDGCLVYEGVEKDIAEELALDLDEDVENVKVTLSYLQSQGLIETGDSDNYVLPAVLENTGKEGASASRMRRSRQKSEPIASLCDKEVTLEIRDRDKSKSKSIDMLPGGERTTYESRFCEFWNAYPKKKSKGEAEKAWKSIKPDDALLAQMLKTIESAKKSADWTKDGGQWIPYPGTWLRAKGWADEVEKPKQTGSHAGYTNEDIEAWERGDYDRK